MPVESDWTNSLGLHPFLEMRPRSGSSASHLSLKSNGSKDDALTFRERQLDLEGDFTSSSESEDDADDVGDVDGFSSHLLTISSILSSESGMSKIDQIDFQGCQSVQKIPVESLPPESKKAGRTSSKKKMKNFFRSFLARRGLSGRH